MFLKTLRFRIVFFYMLLLVLMMFGFSSLLYQRQSQVLYENLDDLLLARAQGIADAIDTYWEIEKSEAEKDGLSLDMLSKSNNLNFSKIAQRWLHEESTMPDLLNILVQVLDSDGNIIANSKNIPRTILFPTIIYKDALHGAARFEVFSVSFGPEATVPLRAYILPVLENNEVAYIVQVASPLDKIQASLNSLKGILFLLFPITIVITGIIGLILSHTILKPVDKMITAVRNINADNLTSRIDIPRAKGEMQRLAITFNEMLERIESTFLSQKRFVQDASHELKTPLTIMKGELEVALRKRRSVDEYAEILKSSLEEIDRMILIKENLLALARLDENKRNLDHKKLDIHLLLREIVDDVKVLADRKNIEVQYSAGPGIIISGDRSQLKQVFCIVLDNAIKYTPEGGRISVNIEDDKNDVLIKIQDSGIGVSSGDLPHIFNRFYRADKSRSGGGFGLGLSIAKSIVETHKGMIGISSFAGKGTTVTIVLPLHGREN